MEDIGITTVMLENLLSVEASPCEVRDNDQNRIPDLMVKFDREALIEYLDRTTGELTLITRRAEFHGLARG